MLLAVPDYPTNHTYVAFRRQYSSWGKKSLPEVQQGRARLLVNNGSLTLSIEPDKLGNQEGEESR